jgi:hypothetical protein
MAVRNGPGELLHTWTNTPVITGTIPIAITAVPRQRIYVYKAIITLGTPAVTVQFNDSTGGISQPFQIGVNGVLRLDLAGNGDPWFFTALGSTLSLVQSGTSGVAYDLWYLQGP